MGAALSSYTWVARRYNIIAVRCLHETFRTYSLAWRTISFLQEYQGWGFTRGILPFISVWLGIPLEGTEKDEGKKEMFCTELSVYYYLYVLGPQIRARRTGGSRPSLSHLFGSRCPTTPALFTPEHFTAALIPEAPIFSGGERTLETTPADMGVVLFQPLILLLFFCVLLYMLLPKGR